MELQNLENDWGLSYTVQKAWLPCQYRPIQWYARESPRQHSNGIIRMDASSKAPQICTYCTPSELTTCTQEVSQHAGMILMMAELTRALGQEKNERKITEIRTALKFLTSETEKLE